MEEGTTECVPGGLEFLYAEPFLTVQEDHQSHPVWSRAGSPAGLRFVGHGRQSPDRIDARRALSDALRTASRWDLSTVEGERIERRK